MDLVSIIMPCFNNEKFVGDSIESVMAQTYSNWELLICDDGSSDSSKDIIQHYESSDPRIRVLPNRYSKGAPGARNSCLESARGRYIAFLDADDIWLVDKLAKQIAFMNLHQYDFVYSYYTTVDELGSHIDICKSPGSVNLKRMRYSGFIGCLTVIYDTDKIGKCFQPNIKKRNDYALWLTILSKYKGQSAHCLPEITAKYRVHNLGLSSDKMSILLRFYRLCLMSYANVTSVNSYYYCFPYLVIMFVKKKIPKLYNFLVCKL